jgi:sulfhydrogenase subunit beta (sulfur reductase)
MTVEKGGDALIAKPQLGELIDALRRAGYQVVGPTMRDGAIVYDEIAGPGDLPEGWTDEHDGGSYRLHRRADDALFGYVVGPHSWKKYLYPPRERLWAARRENGEIHLTDTTEPPARLAFLGVRSCELHAIEIQDRVFMDPQFRSETYAARRESAFIVAVNCGEARGTCFCVSMDTGPRAGSGFDLALTELLGHERHDFLVEVGSSRGSEILAELAARPASEADREAARLAVERATSQMGRKLDTSGIKELLQGNQDHPRWDEVASRCLTCANCTMVCPTCFCSTVEDVTGLDGQHAERWQRWDSCFTMDFSYIHGGSVRRSARSRYRQWMTHKLAHWIDQFDTSGCVGCGRCITWCPVGIDITEEVAAIRASDTRATEDDR